MVFWHITYASLAQSRLTPTNNLTLDSDEAGGAVRGLKGPARALEFAITLRRGYTERSQRECRPPRAELSRLRNQFLSPAVIQFLCEGNFPQRIGVTPPSRNRIHSFSGSSKFKPTLWVVEHLLLVKTHISWRQYQNICRSCQLPEQKIPTTEFPRSNKSYLLR